MGVWVCGGTRCIVSSPFQHYPEVTVEDLLRFGASPEFKFPFEPGSCHGRQECIAHYTFHAVWCLYCGLLGFDCLFAIFTCLTEIAPFPVIEESDAKSPLPASTATPTTAASADTTCSGIQMKMLFSECDQRCSEEERNIE